MERAGLDLETFIAWWGRLSETERRKIYTEAMAGIVIYAPLALQVEPEAEADPWLAPRLALLEIVSAPAARPAARRIVARARLRAILRGVASTGIVGTSYCLTAAALVLLGWG